MFECCTINYTVKLVFVRTNNCTQVCVCTINCTVPKIVFCTINFTVKLEFVQTHNCTNSSLDTNKYLYPSSSFVQSIVLYSSLHLYKQIFVPKCEFTIVCTVKNLNIVQLIVLYSSLRL